MRARPKTIIFCFVVLSLFFSYIGFSIYKMITDFEVTVDKTNACIQSGKCEELFQ